MCAVSAVWRKIQRGSSAPESPKNDKSNAAGAEFTQVTPAHAAEHGSAPTQDYRELPLSVTCVQGASEFPV